MIGKSLGRNAFYNIVYKVLNVIFPMISMAYISRVLLVDGVGRTAAVNNNVSYFLIFASLGIPTYGLRELAKRRDNCSSGDKLFSELFLLNFILSLLTYLIFLAIIFNVDYFQEDVILYNIYGLTIILNIFNIDWLFQALEEYRYITVRSILVKLVSILSLFVFVKSKDDIYMYAIIQVMGTTGNYILNVLRLKSQVHISFRNITFGPHIRPLLYMALGGVSAELYAKMDISMLDYLKGSVVVGYYTNSQKIISTAITILVAITDVFMPRLSYLFEQNKTEFNRLLKTGLNLMITVSIPACIGMMIISKPLVSTFLGIDFFNASVTVSILSLMIPLKCIGDIICYQVMMCASQEAILMKSYFFVMIVNLINNILLIPRFGAEGAALASVVSEALVFIFVFHFSKNYFKLSGTGMVFIKTIICSLIMAVVIYMVGFLRMPPYLELFSKLIVGILTFLLSCCFTKQEVVLKYSKILVAKYMR